MRSNVKSNFNLNKASVNQLYIHYVFINEVMKRRGSYNQSQVKVELVAVDLAIVSRNVANRRYTITPINEQVRFWFKHDFLLHNNNLYGKPSYMYMYVERNIFKKLIVLFPLIISYGDTRYI